MMAILSFEYENVIMKGSITWLLVANILYANINIRARMDMEATVGGCWVMNFKQ